MYILMFSLLTQEMPFENFNLIDNILMLLIIFNTYASSLGNAVELTFKTVLPQGIYFAFEKYLTLICLVYCKTVKNRASQ